MRLSIDTSMVLFTERACASLATQQAVAFVALDRHWDDPVASARITAARQRKITSPLLLDVDLVRTGEDWDAYLAAHQEGAKGYAASMTMQVLLETRWPAMADGCRIVEEARLHDVVLLPTSPH